MSAQAVQKLAPRIALNRWRSTQFPGTTSIGLAADVALAGKRIEPADPRAREYTHYAQTDGNGYFVANGLPAGVFYVAGSVLLPDGESRSPLILKQVKIGAGQTREVDLSR